MAGGEWLEDINLLKPWLCAFGSRVTNKVHHEVTFVMPEMPRVGKKNSKASYSLSWAEVLQSPNKSMLQQKRNWAQWVLHSRGKDWISMQIKFFSALSRSPSPVCVCMMHDRRKVAENHLPCTNIRWFIFSHVCIMFHDAFPGLSWN